MHKKRIKDKVRCRNKKPPSAGGILITSSLFDAPTGDILIIFNSPVDVADWIAANLEANGGSGFSPASIIAQENIQTLRFTGVWVGLDLGSPWRIPSAKTGYNLPASGVLS